MNGLRVVLLSLVAGTTPALGLSLRGASPPSGLEWSANQKVFTWHPTRWSWFETSGWCPPEHLPAPTTTIVLPSSVLPVAPRVEARPQ